MTEASAAVWDAPAETTVYRDEERSLDGLVFKVQRRSLTFAEETRILAQCTDARTKRPDAIELLARTVEVSVKSTSFDLTPDRVRKFLPDRPGMAWFLIRWLCADTLAHVQPDSMEDVRKKSGP